MFGEAEKIIRKILNKNLEAVKDNLKQEDVKRQGFLSEDTTKDIMKKFGISNISYDRFKKGDLVDYIKLLKYYI